MKPTAIEKVWGHTTELFANNTTAMYYLDILASGYCSQHRHAQKDNAFYVIEGELLITSWSNEPISTEHTTRLRAGESCRVATGTWHRFEAVTATKCIEVYVYEHQGADIERRTVGGIKSD